MDSPYSYPITIRLEPVKGEPIHGDEMFVARCEHFPKVAMAEGSPQKAYDGLMSMIEKAWAVKVGHGDKAPETALRLPPITPAIARRVWPTRMPSASWGRW